MLFKHLRKHMKNIMWGIAILIVPAFVIWNIGSAVRNRRSGYAGKLFDQKVSWKEFTSEKRAAHNEMLMKYGEQYPEKIDLDEQTWTRLILLSETKKAKIKVTNDELLNYIRGIPFFKFADLNPENYALIVGRFFQQSPADFEKGVKNSLLISKFMNNLVADITVTEEEIKNEYSKEFEKAVISYGIIDPKDFLETVTLDDQTKIEAYYQTAKEEFKTPEQVNVDYIEIKLESFKDAIEITDERISKYYDLNKEEFKKETAEKDIEKQEYKQLAEVKNSIKEKLIEKEMTNRAQDIARKIMSKLYEETDLGIVAESFGLTAQETGPFSMLAEIPNVGLSFPFLKASFDLEVGEISEIIKTPTSFYILKPKKKISPYIPEYVDIKNKVFDSYKNAEAYKFAVTKAQDLRTQLTQLIDAEEINFEQAAKKLKLEVKTVDNLTRSGYIPELGFVQELSIAAFALNPGEISDAINSPGGVCIFKLEKIVPVEAEKFQEQKKDYSQQLIARKRNQFLNDWFNQIKQEANPETYLEDNPQ